MTNIIYGTDTDSVEDASQCVLIDVPEYLDADETIEWINQGEVFMQSVVGEQDTLEALTIILKGESLNGDMIDRILTALVDTWTPESDDPTVDDE